MSFLFIHEHIWVNYGSLLERLITLTRLTHHLHKLYQYKRAFADQVKNLATTLTFCRLNKVPQQTVAPAHVLAQQALRTFVPEDDAVPGDSSR